MTRHHGQTQTTFGAVPDLKSHLQLIPAHIVIDPGQPMSTRHACGSAKVQRMFPGQVLTAPEQSRLTGTCHDSAPGGTVTLTVSFIRNGKPDRPKGELRLTTNRGKLSPSRLMLDGSTDHVTARFTAPDETIKVSIRAYLEGFQRGKIHLHLDEEV